jgi:hypothetical protein
MKTKVVTLLCAVAIGWCGLTPTCAAGESSPEWVAADALVARPACFVATVLGSACFIVALPFAACSKSVKKTADTLVVKPAKATFTRPLGDFDDLDW